MIIEMLEMVKRQFSVEFMANIADAIAEIQKGTSEENASDDLAYAMKKASGEESGKDKRKVASVFALMIWYKYYRIGKFHVEGLFEREIEKIDLSKENEIRKILEWGSVNGSGAVKFWSDYAFKT